MQGNDGTFYVKEKEREKVWNTRMSKSMNGQYVDAGTVKERIKKIEEIMQHFKHPKIGKAHSPSEE